MIFGTEKKKRNAELLDKYSLVDKKGNKDSNYIVLNGLTNNSEYMSSSNRNVSFKSNDNKIYSFGLIKPDCFEDAINHSRKPTMQGILRCDNMEHNSFGYFMNVSVEDERGKRDVKLKLEDLLSAYDNSVNKKDYDTIVAKSVSKCGLVSKFNRLNFDENTTGVDIKTSISEFGDVGSLNYALRDTRYSDKKGLRFAHHINNDGKVSYGYVVFDNAPDCIRDKSNLTIKTGNVDETFVVLTRDANDDKKITPSHMSMHDIMNAHNNTMKEFSENYEKKVDSYRESSERVKLNNTHSYFYESGIDNRHMSFPISLSLDDSSRLFVHLDDKKNRITYKNNELAVDLCSSDNKYNVTYLDDKNDFHEVLKMTSAEIAAYYDMCRSGKTKTVSKQVTKDDISGDFVYLRDMTIDSKGCMLFNSTKFGECKCNIPSSSLIEQEDGRYLVELPTDTTYRVKLEPKNKMGYNQMGFKTKAITIPMSAADIKMCQDAYDEKMKSIKDSRNYSREDVVKHENSYDLYSATVLPGDKADIRKVSFDVDNNMTLMFDVSAKCVTRDENNKEVVKLSNLDKFNVSYYDKESNKCIANKDMKSCDIFKRYTTSIKMKNRQFEADNIVEKSEPVSLSKDEVSL